MSKDCFQAAQRKPSISAKSSGRVPVIFPGENRGTSACVPPGTKKRFAQLDLTESFLAR